MTCWRITLGHLSALDNAHDKQQHDSANEGGENGVDDAGANGDAEVTEQLCAPVQNYIT